MARRMHAEQQRKLAHAQAGIAAAAKPSEHRIEARPEEGEA